MRIAAVIALCCCTAAAQPGVHSVETDGDFVVVRSSGLSLAYLGPLQINPAPGQSAQQFTFRIPAHPRAATGRHTRVPFGVIGAFVNGLPIYNQFEALSYSGANLWHYDPIATPHGGPGLLEQLIPGNGRHSPLIGFALDGFPIYGPWTTVDGQLRKMRSSYRLRAIANRHVLPDGTRLTPEQFGPDVTDADPLGTFAEDYEYAPGSGDLDEFNGRFAITPEYPNGTYAYFLSTFPYLIGPRYFGEVKVAAEHFDPIGKQRIALSSSDLKAGCPVRFRLEALDSHGEPIRNFEYVHERPIHFLIASSDLEDFDHIHPELAADDSFQVSHTFARGGRYRIWLDYSLPGEAPRVEPFDIDVAGARPARKAEPPQRLSEKPLRAGEDIPIRLPLPANGIEPYLGAWAHVIVVSRDLSSFAHAHPIEAAVHSHVVTGPAPEEIHTMLSFPEAGSYKLWLQFQQAGQVVTVPYELNVEAGVATPKASGSGGIPVRVTQHGFDPASIEIPANTAVRLAFTRDSSPNCGSEIVFPSLGIRKALPLGETVRVDLPAQPASEIRFACGMGMFRGMIVAK